MAVADLPKLKGVRFTPTQQRIMDLLSDGESHAKGEVRTCLWDDLGAMKNIHPHIVAIRKAIRPLGYIITIQFRARTPHYILSQSISPESQS